MGQPTCHVILIEKSKYLVRLTQPKIPELSHVPIHKVVSNINHLREMSLKPNIPMLDDAGRGMVGIGVSDPGSVCSYKYENTLMVCEHFVSQMRCQSRGGSYRAVILIPRLVILPHLPHPLICRSSITNTFQFCQFTTLRHIFRQKFLRCLSIQGCHHEVAVDRSSTIYSVTKNESPALGVRRSHIIGIVVNTVLRHSLALTCSLILWAECQRIASSLVSLTWQNGLYSDLTFPSLPQSETVYAKGTTYPRSLSRSLASMGKETPASLGWSLDAFEPRPPCPDLWLCRCKWVLRRRTLSEGCGRTAMDSSWQVYCIVTGNKTGPSPPLSLEVVLQISDNSILNWESSKHLTFRSQSVQKVMAERGLSSN
ncbi:hypothetical protein KC329_g68 [Hortaea werneckii]|nr:hypothetical protein KC329_g68 [Hortaea werneckii]